MASTGRAVRRGLLATVLGVLAPTVGACSSGCSDVIEQDGVVVALSPALLDGGSTVRARLCEPGRPDCAEVSAPAGEATVLLSFGELAPGPDLRSAGTIEVAVVDAAGRTRGSRSAPYDFTTTRDGVGCDAALRQRIVVDASTAGR